MSPMAPLSTSTSFSAPFFSVTSRRPSGRKVIAQGSANFAMTSVANGLPSAAVVMPASAAGASADIAGVAGAADCALLGLLQAVVTSAAAQARDNRCWDMGTLQSWWLRRVTRPPDRGTDLAAPRLDAA